MIGKRVLFLYTNYNREHLIISRIGGELKGKGFRIDTLYVHDEYIIIKALRMMPNIIVAPPINNDNQVVIYSALKLLTRAIVIAFPTEGYMDYRDIKILKREAGYYQYPGGLIDYVFFWGPLAKTMLGNELRNQNKVSYSHQLQCFGYPLYENVLESSVDDRINRFKLNGDRKKVLVIFGFQGSEYSQREVVNAQDLFDVNLSGEGRKKKIQEQLRLISEMRDYRDKYINLIVKASQRNGDVDFIIKPHPIELTLPHKQVCYFDRLRNIDNIHLLEENIPVSSLLESCDAVVHYGSTINMESYVFCVPTLKIEGLEGYEFGNSTYSINNFNLDLFCKYIERIKAGEDLYRRIEDVENELYEFVNLKVGEPYHPSKDMAEFIDKKLIYHHMKINKQLRNRITEEIKREVIKKEWEL